MAHEESSGRASYPGEGAEARLEARETLIVLLAALAVMDGLIHLGAAVDHFRELPLYTVVFVLLGATQIAWAALVVKRPSNRLLLAGCAFNAGVIALWVASRTVGVPIAPRAWVPETVGVADLVETLGELVVVIGAWSVAFSSRARLARHVGEHLAAVVVLMLAVSALYGVSAHAG